MAIVRSFVYWSLYFRESCRSEQNKIYRVLFKCIIVLTLRRPLVLYWPTRPRVWSLSPVHWTLFFRSHYSFTSTAGHDVPMAFLPNRRFTYNAFSASYCHAPLTRWEIYVFRYLRGPGQRIKRNICHNNNILWYSIIMYTLYVYTGIYVLPSLCTDAIL